MSAIRDVFLARAMSVARRTRPARHLPKRQKRINSSLTIFFCLQPAPSPFWPLPDELCSFPFRLTPPSPSPSAYEPIFFGFILLVLAVPHLRGASSSVRKDESAPAQCILRIGYPSDGLLFGVVRSNAGESTDIWTKAQKTGK